MAFVRMKLKTSYARLKRDEVEADQPGNGRWQFHLARKFLKQRIFGWNVGLFLLLSDALY